MPLNYNGNSILNINYNNTPLTQVTYNGVTVWQQTPTIKTITPDIVTPNYEDITENSVTWYVRNNDNTSATIYSRLSNEAIYTSVISVSPGANATFSRTGLLDKYTYTIQAHAIATNKLQSENAIEEQFTTKTVYYGVKWYDGYDAAPYFSQSIEKGTTVNAATPPPVPEELGVGYEFDYWEVNSNPATFPYTVNENTNFIAVWKVVNYTVTWKNWDGTTLKTQTVGSGYTLTTSDQPTASRTGYTFTGWSPELPEVIYANTTLTAQYSINSYWLRWYDADGISIKSQLINYNTYIDSSYAPASPSNPGYTFTGWSPTLPFYMPASDRNMIPQYTVNSYIIRWLNWDSTVLKTQTLNSGYQVTTSDAPSNPSRTGYTFTGWSPALPKYVVDANIDFTAQFSVNSYTCYWFYGDGTYTTRNYNYGTVISSAPIDPGAVSCKYLTGWSPSLPYTITGSTSFYPQYSYYVYTATWVDGWGNTLKTKTYNCGSTVPSGDYPTVAASDCHTFTGWDVAAGFTITSNRTITAQWSLKYYTIKWYDFDGAPIRTLSKCCGCSVTSTDYPSNPTPPSCRTWNGWNKSPTFYVYQNWNIVPNTPGYTTPGVPSSMTGSSPSNNRLNLSWGTGSCASSYTYEYKLTTSGTWTTASTTGTSKTGIVVGAGYYDIRVKAVNGTESSTYKVGADVRVYGSVY